MITVNRIYFLAIVISFSINFSYAQSFWFGAKAGPTLAFQRWLDFDPNPLLTWGADIAFESYSEDSKSSLYGQIGYHNRGSSLRAFTWQGESIGRQGFRFRNIVAELGAKRQLDPWSDMIPYYHLGFRLEYNINTNLEDYERFNSLFYPNDAFVRKWTYGPSLGGGFEWTNFDDLIRPYTELTFGFDVADQYFQGAIPNVIGPFGQPTTLRERVIRNLTFQVKVGVKFLRKVEYID